MKLQNLHFSTNLSKNCFYLRTFVQFFISFLYVNIRFYFTKINQQHNNCTQPRNTLLIKHHNCSKPANNISMTITNNVTI